MSRGDLHISYLAQFKFTLTRAFCRSENIPYHVSQINIWEKKMEERKNGGGKREGERDKWSVKW